MKKDLGIIAEKQSIKKLEKLDPGERSWRSIIQPMVVDAFYLNKI
jgi:hypothetical protein